MGMQPIPRPPLGHNPRKREEQDLDEATEHEQRAREAAGARSGGPVRRLLHALRRRRS